jgi:hypothetical protein
VSCSTTSWPRSTRRPPAESSADRRAPPPTEGGGRRGGRLATMRRHDGDLASGPGWPDACASSRAVCTSREACCTASSTPLGSTPTAGGGPSAPTRSWCAAIGGSGCGHATRRRSHPEAATRRRTAAGVRRSLDPSGLDDALAATGTATASTRTAAEPHAPVRDPTSRDRGSVTAGVRCWRSCGPRRWPSPFSRGRRRALACPPTTTRSHPRSRRQSPDGAIQRRRSRVRRSRPFMQRSCPRWRG